MITGTKVRALPNPANLAEGTWLSTVLFYDDRGRVLQTHSDNCKGGVDVATNLYNFSGAVLSSLLVHNNPQNPEAALKELIVQTNMKYDHAGRLTEISKSVEGAAEKIIVAPGAGLQPCVSMLLLSLFFKAPSFSRIFLF
jgi:hypothetical protein